MPDFFDADTAVTPGTGGPLIRLLRRIVGGKATQAIVVDWNFGGIESFRSPFDPILGVPSNPSIDIVSAALFAVAAVGSGRQGYIYNPVSNTNPVYLNWDVAATSNDFAIYPGDTFNISLGIAGPPMRNALWAISPLGIQTVKMVLSVP